MKKGIKGIDLELSSLLAVNEFMASPPCLFLFVRHVALHQSHTPSARDVVESAFDIFENAHSG